MLLIRLSRSFWNDVRSLEEVLSMFANAYVRSNCRIISLVNRRDIRYIVSHVDGILFDELQLSYKES